MSGGAEERLRNQIKLNENDYLCDVYSKSHLLFLPYYTVFLGINSFFGVFSMNLC